MDDSSKQVTVIDDGVEAQRTIEDRPTATVAVYRLTTLASAPSVVHIEEAIPPEDRIETLEFHPDHLPNDWSTEDGTLQFEAIVRPNDTQMVVLGLEAADESPLELDEPDVSHLDLEMGDPLESNGSVPRTRGGDTDTPDEDRSSILGHDIETIADGGDTTVDSDSDDVLDLADPNADSEDMSDDSDSDDVLDLQDPNADDEDTGDGSDSDDVLDLQDPNADESSSAGDEAAQSPEIDGDAEPDSEETGPGEHNDDQVDLADPNDESDTEDAAVDPGPDADATDDLGLDDDPGLDDDATDDPGLDDDPGPDDDSIDDLGLDESEGGSATTADGESTVGDLLADIQAGRTSEEELDALRSELGVARADEVRFEHVQSRMSDFEAYVDALEGIINSHGTASEFVDRIERQVTDLEEELSVISGEVSTVETELETADDEREQLTEEVADLDETVDGLADEVAELHDLVETVDERTDSLETELRGEIETLREERADQFDRIESELETTREELEADFESELEAIRQELEADVESELDSLREDVESFNELRHTLLDAFGSGLDVAPEADTAER